jgi:hypothetical protein
MTIQHLKQLHLQTFLIAIVTGELGVRQTLIPISFVL